MNYKELVSKGRKGWRMFVAVAFVLLLAACGTQSSPADTPAADETGPASALLGQLEAVKQNLSGNQLPLNLVGMTFGATLESAAQVDALRTGLVADQALVPQYDGAHAESFSLNTIQARMNDFQLDTQSNQNVVANIQSEVFPLIKTGQRTVDLTWESGGEQFHTTCVYDEQGIVYDNLLSNLVLVEEEQPSTLEDNATLPDTSGLQAQGTYAFTSRVLNYRIKWIWGGTRGRIKVYHTILWNGRNYIYSQNGSAHHYMTLGKTGAKTKGTRRSPHRYATMAYGYAWATPSASFSISYSAKGASFKVSLGGVGSRGGGAAHHTIYIS